MRPGSGDSYYRRAKSEGLAARSVFKLKEIDSKFKLIRAGDRVLDLGCSPGSWLEYAAEKVGTAGIVVGVDPVAPSIRLPANARYVKSDLLAFDPSVLESKTRFDLVMSDAAPHTTGNREGDHLQSVEICLRALDLALQLLKGGGHFVCKMYQGEESAPFLEKLRQHFARVKTQKPEASRRESREVYFVACSRI